MTKFYTYNEVLNNNITPIKSTLKEDLAKKKIFNQSQYLDTDSYMNPCRMLWGTYKIANNFTDDQFIKKLVGTEYAKGKVDNFLNFTHNLNKRIDYYIANTHPKLNKTQITKLKSDILKTINDILEGRCTIDKLTNKSNPLANAIISQILVVPNKYSDVNKNDTNDDDDLYDTIISYSGSLYDTINPALRGLSSTPPSESTINAIVNLDIIFDYFAVTSVANRQGLRLFRGLDKVFYLRNGINGTADRAQDLQIGDILNDKAFMSSSIDINGSLNPNFFKFSVSDKIMPCCCILTFVYPPHFPFITMADFNVEDILSKKHLQGKQTAFGFTETELLLPRNTSFKVINKIKLDEYLYMDFSKELKFKGLTIVECEVAFELEDTMVKTIKDIKNPVNVSSMLYKNIIYRRNSKLSQDSIKIYNQIYERKIKKFKINKTWFNNTNKPYDTINFVLKPTLQLGGDFYDKYVKYKTKYLELKNQIDQMNGGQMNSNISNSFKMLLKMFLISLAEQNCCLNMLEKYQFKKSNVIVNLATNFNKFVSDNQKSWKGSVGGLTFLSTKNEYDIYNSWVKKINDKSFNLEKNLMLFLNMFYKWVYNYNSFLLSNVNNVPITSTKIKNIQTSTFCVACEQENSVCKKLLYYDLPVTTEIRESCTVYNEVGNHCCNPDEKTLKCLIEHYTYLNNIYVNFKKIYDNLTDKNLKSKIDVPLNKSKELLDKINVYVKNIKL